MSQPPTPPGGVPVPPASPEKTADAALREQKDKMDTPIQALIVFLLAAGLASALFMLSANTDAAKAMSEAGILQSAGIDLAVLIVLMTLMVKTRHPAAVVVLLLYFGWAHLYGVVRNFEFFQAIGSPTAPITGENTPLSVRVGIYIWRFIPLGALYVTVVLIRAIPAAVRYQRLAKAPPSPITPG